MSQRGLPKSARRSWGLIVALLSYMGPGSGELISPATFFLCKVYLLVGQRPQKEPPSGAFSIGTEYALV